MQTGTGVALPISGTSTADADFHANFTTDNGTDIGQPGTTHGNILFPMAAGADTSLGGPTATAPEFNRAHATVTYVSASTTITLDIVAIADPATGRCTFAGTAVPSS